MNSQKKNDFIREWYSECSAKVIADYLGVTIYVVYARANRMKLSRDNEARIPPTKHDIYLMHELLEYLPPKDIAIKFNLTEDECVGYLEDYHEHKKEFFY